MVTLVSCDMTPINKTTETINSQTDSIATQTQSVENSINFATYCNTRYDYCIDYPDGIIYPQPESLNGDGLVFKNKHGEKVLVVYGHMKIDPDGGGELSLGEQYYVDLHRAFGENGNQDRVITYQKLGKTFFVLSGYKKGKIFYQKTILKENAFASAFLEYSESDKEVFDKVSAQLFKSFK